MNEWMNEDLLHNSYEEIKHVRSSQLVHGQVTIIFVVSVC